MLDAAHVAGGIRVNGAEQTIVDRVFVAHYASGSHGILGDIEAGFSNELLVSESFFAEFDWGEPGFNDTSLQNGTGIEMRFYDSHFTNVIVRCTKVGIVEAGGGNVYQNVHVYATCNKNGPANVAPGMIIAPGAEATRISGANFDDSPLVVMSPVDLLLTNSIFYGLSGLVFAPQQEAIAWGRGVLVTGNTFRGTPYAPNPTIAYDTSKGSLDIARLSGFIIADNSFSEGAQARTTRATAVVGVAVAPGGAPPCEQRAFAGVANLTGALIFAPLGQAPPVRHAPAVAEVIARVAAAAVASAAASASASTEKAFSAPPLRGAAARGEASAAAAAAAVVSERLPPQQQSLPFPPGIASISGAISLANPPAGVFGVFNAVPTPGAFGILNVSAAVVGGAAGGGECPGFTGVVTIVVDQGAPSSTSSAA